MRLQGFVRSGSPIGLAVLAATVVAACGSSGPAARLSPTARAQSLLRQTFGAVHRIESGRVGFTLTLTASSSATSADPISISLAGPFQSRGANRLPASDFNVSVSARNRTSSLSVISTGDAGYITAGGESYQLPPRSFRTHQTGDSVAAHSSWASGSTVVDPSTLEIHPLDWVIDPRVVGSDSIAGVTTTRIHGPVDDVAKLAADISTLLSKAYSLGLSMSSSVAKLPERISAAGRQQVAAKIRDTSVDIWTGAADRLLRKLSVSFKMPGSGSGTKPVAVALTLQYSDVNEPQTITAPANAQPYSAFQAKLAAQQLATARPERVPRSQGTTNPAANDLTLSPYAQCIANAAGNVTKMQACSSLSNGAKK